MVLKQVARMIAHSAGYEIIPEWRLHRYPQAEYLAKLFEFCGITHVIDVGANKGQYYDFLRVEVGFDGTVISFEPNKDLVAGLRSRAGREKNWLVFDCALGAARGQAEFNVMKSTEFSSFLPPDHSAVGLFGDMNVVAKTIVTEVHRLDEMLDGVIPKSSERRIYLKLDTQGFDLEVLKGCDGILGDICALQTEASVRPIYAGSPSYDQAIAQIRERGYELSAIYPNNEGHFPLLVEFDCHMIRRDLVPSTHLGAL